MSSGLSRNKWNSYWPHDFGTKTSVNFVRLPLYTRGGLCSIYIIIIINYFINQTVEIKKGRHTLAAELNRTDQSRRQSYHTNVKAAYLIRRVKKEWESSHCCLHCTQNIWFIYLFYFMIFGFVIKCGPVSISIAFYYY